MEVNFLHIVAISLSLYVFGVLRTALWIFPSILFREFWPIFSASWISFFLVASWICPYQKGFDFRGLRKDKWTLIFFLTGVFSGSLLYPVPLWAFGIGALFPLVWIRIFRLLQRPPSEIYVAPKYFRILMLFLWLIAFGFRWVEWPLS